jgi:hypothetical protein
MDEEERLLFPAIVANWLSVSPLAYDTRATA